MDTKKVIDLTPLIDPVCKDIIVTKTEVIKCSEEIAQERKEINELILRAKSLTEQCNISVSPLETLPECTDLNSQIDIVLIKNYKIQKYSKLPKLSAEETIVSCIAGIISVLIDVIFVGTPEVVKLYKGGENFDGSILTAALRKIGSDGSGNLSPLFNWFSKKCKVPYDIPAYKGVVTPDNHRLRSLSHDPFFGLFFAIADIILGTTTCVNNNGQFTILMNDRKSSTPKKWLAVFYYLGHIISDVCTARGIPVPGFFVSQFFTSESEDLSIAEIAESMYKDGYDLRHFASMSVPVFVKDMIIQVYLKLTQQTSNAILSIAEREKCELDLKLKKYKMKFIANSVATVGNTVKFIAPPNCGNPCALSFPQWIAFIQNGIVMILAMHRDFSPEQAMYDRTTINNSWKDILKS